MKKITKKLFSLLLAVSIIFGTFSFSVFAAEGDAATNIPTVYVHGYGGRLYVDATSRKNGMIFDDDKEMIFDGTIEKLMKAEIKPLMKGITTGNWTEFNDTFVDIISKDLGRLALDENGEASNGTGYAPSLKKAVENKKNANGKYEIYTFYFNYDWRVDPFQIADEINDYIQDVKAVTGFEKVNIVGRCYGGNLVLAYLQKYGYNDINSIQFYVAGLDGFDFVGAMFSGEMEFNTTAINNYVQMHIDAKDDPMIKFAKKMVSIMYTFKTLDIPVWAVEKIYKEVYSDILPRILLNSFATMPAFWSYVNDEYYDTAKNLIFSTPELQAKYAKLIEKIDYYHYNVFQKTKELIDNANAVNSNVYIVAKYGTQLARPIAKEAVYNSDDTISVYSQTLGATATILGRTFNNTYLIKAKKNGTYKYISPDKCIDASTGYLPDHTWYIKGSSHSIMPKAVDTMMAAVFDLNGTGERYVTVNDIKEFPQYNYVSKDTTTTKMYPLTEKNVHKTETVYRNVAQIVIEFFEDLFASFFALFKR